MIRHNTILSKTKTLIPPILNSYCLYCIPHRSVLLIKTHPRQSFRKKKGKYSKMSDDE